MKLWQKNEHEDFSSVQKQIEEFTVGNDRTWDLYLAEADIRGSMAHAEMLRTIGLLSGEENRVLQEGLAGILQTVTEGTFEIAEGIEDVHSQVEMLLTKNKGEVGKKIHSGRSRNDQSLLDIKLFIRAELKKIAEKMQVLFDLLIALSEKHKDILMPGYTHMQLAMPSSFGLWFGAYAESLSDDAEMLIAAYKIADKNPLGSGAGYGSSFPLNRQLTTELLGFNEMNYNVVYAQMTRGKTEKITAMALASVAATLSKLSGDVCLYMGQDFNFFSFPAELTTGSSIMPHKKNPDVFELVRARCNRIQALPNELSLLLANLPSGYHRDLQLTKDCLFPALFEMGKCIDMLVLMLSQVKVNSSLMEASKYSNLFTVEKVNQLVLGGMPFRDAYREVARQVDAGEFRPGFAAEHVHEGSRGNLCNEAIRERFMQKMEVFRNSGVYSSSGI